MMLVLNPGSRYIICQNTTLWVCSSKENVASSTVQINPTNYLVHPKMFREVEYFWTVGLILVS